MKPSPLTNPPLKALLKRIEKHRATIAKERDALYEILSEVESLFEPVNRGVEALDDAIQAFSEQA
jgi:hypothetical protein